MAKKSKGGKDKPAATEKVKPSETLLMPNTKDVVDLARRCKALQKQGREASGAMGEKIAQAVEDKRLDRKAFSIARGLEAMSDERLSITYYHLLRYMDDLGLEKRASAQGQMFEQEEGTDGEDPPGDGKLRVVASRETAEAAGG